MIDSDQKEKIADYQIITRIFDTHPDAVVWFIPKFAPHDKSTPVDFEVAYCNTSASLILTTPRNHVIGTMVKTTKLVTEGYRQLVFEQCLRIWKTGEHIEYTYFSPEMNKHFNVQRSKSLNGILSITRDHTAFVNNHLEKEQQSKLLTQIIESSTSGISLYEAIRGKDGQIVDFRLRLANKKSAEITAFSLDELYKYTVKELMVIRGQAGYFEMLCKVVNTGEPVYTEYYASARKQWVAFSIQKFDDGYLLNYIDITKTKNLENQAKLQAEMLNGILNASITGLITIQAIYDSSGKIEDFKFVLLNDAAEKLLSIKKEDLTKTYLNIFPGAKNSGFFDLYVNVLMTGKSVSKEIFYKSEGYNGWYYISVSKMNADTLVQSFADITHTRENKS